MSKKKMILHSTVFLAIFAILLELFSFASIRMGKTLDPLFNHSAYGIFEEPEKSIDVLAIGDSNIYSSVSPLMWWQEHGITGYTWGEPSQRIPETYEYLKKIYRHQSPSVVLIDGNNLFREKTDIQILDSIVKAKAASLFPVISLHNNLNIHKISTLFSGSRSVTKGYYYRPGHRRVRKKTPWIRPGKKTARINSISASVFKKCVQLCKKNGSTPVLISVPNCSSWNYARYNALKKIARDNGVAYIDLNLELQHELNWKKDSADGGEHLNIRGAKKTTAWLGNYLSASYVLPDHRGEKAYRQWDKDVKNYNRMVTAHRASRRKNH